MGKRGQSGGRGAERLRPIARRTGRTARHTPAAVAAARRLTESETLDLLRLTPRQIAFLDRCANGFPPRNALAAITALKLKLEYTQRKPKQEIEVTEVAAAQDVTDEEWAVLSALRHQVRAADPEVSGG